jgi:hypothetical protein
MMVRLGRGWSIKFGFGEIALDLSGLMTPWALYLILRYGTDSRLPFGWVIKPRTRGLYARAYHRPKKMIGHRP